MGWIHIRVAGSPIPDNISDLATMTSRDHMKPLQSLHVDFDEGWSTRFEPMLPVPDGIVNDKGEPIHGHSSNDR